MTELEVQPPRPSGSVAALFVNAGASGVAGAQELDELARALVPVLADHHLTEAHLHLAWELAHWERQLDAAERRALFLLALATLAASQQGSTHVPLGTARSGLLLSLLGSLLGEPVTRECPALAALSPARLQRDIQALVDSGHAGAVLGDATARKPLVIEDGHIYQERLHAAEHRCAAELLRLLRSSPKRADAREVKLGMRRATDLGPDFELSKEQQQAVQVAGGQPLAVITGGPGTGKTSIVVAILRLLVTLGTPANQILLAAPTGKAAHRLSDLVTRKLRALPNRTFADMQLESRQPAQTLHRLLGYSQFTGRFSRHRNNPLSAEAVIVDEASMIDLTLMMHLLAALPQGARLVLLGDADQLPSVAAGAVFRDLADRDTLVKATERSVVRLQQSFRMNPGDPEGRSILLAANAIRDGHSPLDVALCEVPRRAAASDIAFSGCEWLETDPQGGGLADFLGMWFEQRIAPDAELTRLVNRTYGREAADIVPEDHEDLARLFAAISTSRILTLTRGNRTGCVAINSSLQDLLRIHQRIEGRQRFHVGEPLMMLKNDYARGIYNGDQGSLIWVAEAGSTPRLQCVFPVGEGYRVVAPQAIAESLELSYAITVHKSQGSELNHTAVVLPEQNIPLLTRELLYTGVTRSSRSVVLVGNAAILARGARNKLDRHTGLGKQLAALAEPPPPPAGESTGREA